ncbi:unnamed protein product [Brachionus calyciflorus]|uniref:Uncharacterized protein n=1 Tax=Brachionus calyciflorus TaxID=104777 RepID=A0A813UI18_9BILA|nr:unnamed protein product [Brachionus calyciflorus]
MIVWQNIVTLVAVFYHITGTNCECVVSSCLGIIEKKTYLNLNSYEPKLHFKTNNMEEICYDSVKFYNCLLDKVSEECLINRDYINYFNQIETVIKQCNQNDLIRNRNFYNYLKNHLPKAIFNELEGDESLGNEKEIHLYDKTSPNNQILEDKNEKFSDIYAQSTSVINLTMTKSQILENEYSFTTTKSIQSKITKCYFMPIKRCNFLKNKNLSFLLASNNKIFVKKLVSKKKETMNFVDNSLFNLTVEYNYKTDFKLFIKIKQTNCTNQELYIIESKNGILIQHKHSDEIVIKSKTNHHEKSQDLNLKFRPFDLTIEIYKNRKTGHIAINLDFPGDSDYLKNEDLCNSSEKEDNSKLFEI